MACIPPICVLFIGMTSMKITTKNILFLWPGAYGVIAYGLWRQLFIALTFSIFLLATLFSHCYWTDFPPHFIKRYYWLCFILTWLFLSVYSYKDLHRYTQTKKYDEKGEAFLEAQTQYLHGNWFETECCIKNILKRNPEDVEALLFLATLLRHLKRYSEAKKILAEMEKYEESSRWSYEILQERNAIQEEERHIQESPQKKKG